MSSHGNNTLAKKPVKDYVFYRASTANGICVDNVDPSSREAALILTLLEPKMSTCDWPGEAIPTAKGSFYRSKKCGYPAVRVAAFFHQSKNGKKATSFAGLCERHKQMGMWTNAERAWGWD